MSTVTVPTSLGGTGTTYRSDDGANGMASDGGYGYTSQDLLFEMLGEVITANQTGVYAAAAATNAANVNGTSTSSQTIGSIGETATFQFVESNRSIAVGMRLLIADDSNPAVNYEVVAVETWNSGTRTFTGEKLKVGGSGTFTAWSISLTADPAVTGEDTTTLGALINGASAKTTPVDADMFALMDSAASNVVKKLSWANVKATMFAAWGALVAAATDKTAPVGADEFAIADSAAASATKRLSMTNLAAFLASLSQTLTNKTLTSPVITGGTADTFSIGYKEIPSNSQSTAYTAVLSDSGKSIDHPSTDANARTFTIPANASVAYPIGTCLSFSNMTSQVVTIAITSDTLYLAGSGSTGSRSLAKYGTATARKLTSTTWIIAGVGLT